MAVAEDIQTLAERTHRDLAAVHDFLAHSMAVWKSFRKSVKAGHRITDTNRATGTRVTQDDLLRLSQPYARDYLVVFTFQRRFP